MRNFILCFSILEIELFPLKQSHTALEGLQSQHRMKTCPADQNQMGTENKPQYAVKTKGSGIDIDRDCESGG